MIGDAYQGGKVAYIFMPGDPRYIAGRVHGLLAAAEDLPAMVRWDAEESVSVTGATGTALGTGFDNTNKIIAASSVDIHTYAAGLARLYEGGGHTDWYLPSKDELNKLYLARGVIGGLGEGPSFQYPLYWSSTEYDEYQAWDEYFTNDDRQSWVVKWTPKWVRPVRLF